MKKCIFCNKEFSPKTTASKVCYKTECQREYVNMRMTKYRAHQHKDDPCFICGFPLTRMVVINEEKFPLCLNHKFLIYTTKCITIEDLRNYGKLA